MIQVDMKRLAKQMTIDVHRGFPIVGIEEATFGNGTILLAVCLGLSSYGEQFCILILVALSDSIVSARRVIRPDKRGEDEEENNHVHPGDHYLAVIR